MGKPYSQDLRERVIAAVDGGIGAYAAAALFRVSVSYIYKVLGRRRATGETKARTGRPGRKAKLAAHDEALRARVAVVPDACACRKSNSHIQMMKSAKKWRRQNATNGNVRFAATARPC
jgi:hypothetical protein